MEARDDIEQNFIERMAGFPPGIAMNLRCRVTDAVFVQAAELDR